MKSAKLGEVSTLTQEEMRSIKSLMIEAGKLFSVKSVILYGSKARGDFTEESDVDVLFIVDDADTSANRKKLYEKSFYTNVENLTDVSPKLRNLQQWEACSIDFPHFKKSVEEDGVLLG